MKLTQRDRPIRGLIPVVLFTAFLAAFSLGATNPIIPALVGQYGGTTVEVGLLYTTLYLANFVASPILGRSSDRYGRRPILLLSLVGIIVGYSLFSLGGALWVFFAGWFVVGLTDGTLGVVFAFAADTTDQQNRTRTFSFISAAMSVGFIVGPLVSGQIARLNPVAPIFVAIAAFAINAVWVYVAMPETHSIRHPLSLSEQQFIWNPIAQLGQTLKLPHLRWLLVSFFLMIATTVITLSHLPAAAREAFNWTPQQLAIPFAAFGVVDFIGQAVILPASLPKLGEIRLAIVGSVLLAIAFALYGAFIATGIVPLLYGAIVMNGIGQPFSESTLNGLMSRSVRPEIQGQIQGGVRATFALGRIVGPLCASGLNRAVSPSAPYWVGVVQMLMAGIAIVLAVPELKFAEQQLSETDVKP
jgi:MFS transporter, DHA1 family, tetracycline resistance protein